MSQNETAKQLSVSQSTLSREFSRDTGKPGYRFNQAQQAVIKRRIEVHKTIKLSPTVITAINEKVSVLEQHIRSDKRSGSHLFQHLRRIGKPYQPRNKDK